MVSVQMRTALDCSMALLARPQLGSISSLRCQKTRNTQLIRAYACKAMFRGRNVGYRVDSCPSTPSGFAGHHAPPFGSCAHSTDLTRRLAAPRVAARRSVVEPDGIEPTTS